MALLSTPDDHDLDATWEVAGLNLRIAGGLVDLFLTGFLASALLTGARLQGWLPVPPEDPTDLQISDLLPVQLLVLGVQVLYYFLWEALTYRTPGKLLCRTRVMGADGDDPSTGAILGRTLLRLVPLELLSFLGPLPGGWHDRWSGTCVVRRADGPAAEADAAAEDDE